MIGYPVVWRFLKNLFKGQLLDETFLMTIASIGAFPTGHEVEAIVVVLLYQIGEILQNRAVNHSRKSILNLLNFEVKTAKIKLDLYDSVYKSFCNIYDSDGKEIYDLRGIYNRAFDCYKIDSEVALNKGIYYISISNYSIDGFNLNYGGTYYFSVNYMQKLTKPLNLKLSAQKGAKIKAKWDSVNGANGYQIYYSRNKNFKKLSAKKIVKGGKKTSYVGKNFTKGRKYYVKVRAYKIVNGKKVYGKWSSVKSVKCK